MLRHAMSELIKWKTRPNLKPLLIRGALFCLSTEYDITDELKE